MKTIAILGCGWLGLPLASALVAQAYTVRGSTTTLDKMPKLQSQGITPFLIDLKALDPLVIEEFLSGVEVLVLAVPPKSHLTDLSYAEQFRTLIPHVASSTTSLIIHMSSTSVYATHPTAQTEDSSFLSATAAAQQLLAAEKTWATLSIPAVVLRLGGLFGPGRHPVTFLAQKQLLDNPDLPVNMIHLQDIIAFCSLLLTRSNSATIFNLVAPYGQSRLEFYTRAAQERQLQLPPWGSTDLEHFKLIDGSKAEKDFDFSYNF